MIPLPVPEQVLSIDELRRLVEERERAIAELSDEVPRLSHEVLKEEAVSQELSVKLSRIGTEGVLSKVWSVLCDGFTSAEWWTAIGGCSMVGPMVAVLLVGVFVDCEETHQRTAFRSHHATGGVLQRSSDGPPLGSLCTFNIHRASSKKPYVVCAVSLTCDDWRYTEKQPCWVHTKKYACGEDNHDTCYNYYTNAGDKDPSTRPFFRYNERQKRVTFINDDGRTEVLLYTMGDD